MTRIAATLIVGVLVLATPVLAQTSAGGGAARGLDEVLERQRLERQLEQRRLEQERAHKLQQQALAIEERRTQAVGRGQSLVSITDAEWQATGLYKLTDTERRALFAWVARSGIGAGATRPAVVSPSSPVASEVESDFDGFKYGAVFTLTNGQIWRQ